MQIIDAHQHFWIYDPERDSWIDNSMSALKKDYLPEELNETLNEIGIQGTVAVQASQSKQETEFLLSLANKFDFIKGVVGWVDLQSSHLEEELLAYKSNKKLKGFRHILQGEKDRSFMLREPFIKGIHMLEKYGYTYDILIYKDQLKYIPQFVAECKEQRFILDHLAKPDIKNKEIMEWKKDMLQLKGITNLYCKVSGFVTEADWYNWKPKDFKDYFDVVVEVFGIDRIVFGSDWPVCLLAASYQQVLQILKDYFSTFSKEEQQKVFASNAISFYNL
jgi:Predicted metal-dependent hydrolase of the TIM-barrel fold